jgi:hypothetical protein
MGSLSGDPATDAADRAANGVNFKVYCRNHKEKEYPDASC